MKLGNYILTVFFLILFSFASNGQSKTIDSLKKILQTQKEDTNKVKTLNELAMQLLLLENPGEKIEDNGYAKQAFGLAEKIEFIKGKARAKQLVGMYFDLQGQFEKARSNYEEAVKYYEQIEDKDGLADVYGSIASSYGGEENISAALEYTYKCLKLFEETGNAEGLFLTYISLAGTNINEQDFETAIKNLNKASMAGQRLSDKMYISFINNSFAEVYFGQGKYTEALKCADTALKILQEAGSVFNQGTLFHIKGDIFQKLGDSIYDQQKDLAVARYHDALKEYQNAVNIYQQTDTKKFIYYTYTKIGDLYTKLGSNDSSRSYLNKSLSYLSALDAKTKKISNNQFEELYHALSRLDSAMGNTAKAYEHYKMYISFRDSASSQEKAKKMQQIKSQYEFDKKEATAALEQERKRIGQWRVIASLGLLILVFLLIMFFQWRGSKQKKLANLLLQQQKEKVESTLSELRSTQSQLIQSEKMASLGELTAGIAHEIQNPLNFVNNFSEVNDELIKELKAEAEKGNLEDVKAIANDIAFNSEKINYHGKRADSIVKGMLQHSRSSTGQKEPTDINALCDEYLRLAYHGMRAKDKSFNATTKTDFDNNIGKLNVVAQDLGRVVLNLINNAFYAVNEKQKQKLNGYEPTVTVTTSKQNGKIEIKVKDNGNGIPQKNIDKIFQPFFTTKPTGQGTGLGLSLAYDIITKGHGGELKVETKEGEGSIFTIQLPANSVA